eukprot:GILK01000626.1.p1 GENE.GILK01000626.1~~GILK01000626.1.p1  ORF type:complete len:546 (-),score=83.25 GILK01000626.1:142-1779(-)
MTMLSLLLAPLSWGFRLFSSSMDMFLNVTGLKGPLWNLFVYILTNQRSFLVFFFVMPLSFVFDCFWRLRTWYIAKYRSAPEEHDVRVKKIQARVREWIDKGKPSRMCTARPGWLTVSPRHCQYKNVLFTVDTTLTDILSLDTSSRILRVEPSVNILQILDYLLPRGFTLPVLPELDELTIGGLVNGYGIETASHKYGLFNEICVAFELVLPDGSLVRVTKDDKLFHTIPWSFGTVAFLTAIELRVIPAAKYVRHKYIPVHSFKECTDLWTELQTSATPPEFLEGFMYNDKEGVIMAADFTNEIRAGDRLNNINWWFKPYFFMHALTFVKENRAGEEIIPLRQYYQRHNRSIFWALQDQIPICHNALFRTLFGWLLPPRVAFLKLIESPAVTKFYEENYVMQDWLVPLEKMEEVMDLCHKELAVYPLWLCPHRVYNSGKWQGKLRAPKGTKKEGDFVHYVDAATIGPPGVKNFNTVKAITALETYLKKVGGYQGNYSYTYQTREDYREMFDHTLYDEVRKEYGGDVAFPESYDKISRKNQWKKKDN